MMHHKAEEREADQISGPIKFQVILQSMLPSIESRADEGSFETFWRLEWGVCITAEY